MKISFYTYFSSAYGTFWLVCMVLAFVSSTHIDLGEFGLYGFPILALIYAWIRWSQDKRQRQLEDFGRERG